METINTITTNFMELWNAPKDWSLDGGLIWLTGYLVFCVISFIHFCVKEAKDERNVRKAKLYRAAEESGRIHLRMKSQKGYLERWNY
jgi:hypothetical protein